MKRYLAIVAIVASLLTGCAGPANAPLAEDDPGWNCHTMGDQHCGVDPWGSFNEDALPADVVSEGFKADYVGAFTADTLPDSLVGMPSKVDSDVIYGFKIEVL